MRWNGDQVRQQLLAQGREVARKLAERTAEGARARVPVDSGKLRDSIEVRPDGDGFLVVAAVPYAAAIEKGSVRNRGHARPFMGPALADAFGQFDAVARRSGFSGVRGGFPMGIGAGPWTNISRG